MEQVNVASLESIKCTDNYVDDSAVVEASDGHDEKHEKMSSQIQKRTLELAFDGLVRLHSHSRMMLYDSLLLARQGERSCRSGYGTAQN